MRAEKDNYQVSLKGRLEMYERARVDMMTNQADKQKKGKLGSPV